MSITLHKLVLNNGNIAAWVGPSGFLFNEATWNISQSSLKWRNRRWGNYFQYSADQQSSTSIGYQYLTYGYVYGGSTSSASTNRPTVGSISSQTGYTIGVTQTTGGTVAISGGYYVTYEGTNYYVSLAQFTLTATPDAGYTFVAWDDGDTNRVRSKTPSSDHTYSATFVPAYTISFDTQNGAGEFAAITDCVADGEYTLPTTEPTRTGYSFAGWNTAADGSGTTYQAGDNYSKETVTAGEVVTLYAQWAQWTLTYDANGGDTTPAAQEFVGEVVLAAAITRSHRAFVGWEIAGELYAPGDTYELTSDVTATAVWNNITIHNLNPAGGSVALIEVSTGETAATEQDGYILFHGTVGTQYRITGTAGRLYTAQADESFILADADILRDFSFTKRNTYTVGFVYEGAAYQGYEIIAPASPDETVEGVDKYLEYSTIRARITPPAGMDLQSVQWKDAGGDNLPSDAPVDGVVTLNEITTDTTGVLSFTRSICTAEAAAHTASASAVQTSVSAASVYYGESVTFTASVDEGYEFEGWYRDAAGTDKIAGAGAEYTIAALTENTKLYAKAKVAVTIGLAYPDGTAAENKTCAITVNGAAFTPGTSFDVALGESFEYALTLGMNAGAATPGNWQFEGWYEDVAEAGSVLAYAQTGTITPTAAVEMTAKVSMSAQKTVTVHLVNMAAFGGMTHEVVREGGAVTTEVISFRTSIPSGELPVAVAGRVLLGASGENEQEVAIIAYSETVTGAQYIQLTAKSVVEFKNLEDPTETETKNFYGIAIADEAEESGAPTVDSRNETSYILLNRDLTIFAYYGEPVKVDTTFALTDGSTGRGEVAIIGISDTSEGAAVTGLTAHATQGTTITVRATAFNGYRFAGWYANKNANGVALYTAAEATVTVTSERTIYALFEPSERAVFEWEGSGTNKEFTWRSKTYSATKPFNPSVARIDTERYPLKELAVEMFSSPDKSATQSVKLTDVTNQTMRRLPARRPERYLQVEVKNNSAVNAVIVSTSAEEARA